MRDAVLRLLRSQPKLLTAGAISVMIGKGAGGTLGQDPDPEVSAALEGLRASAEAATLEACPVCGRPGEVWSVPENVPSDAGPPGPMSEQEEADTMAPLIDEGAIEVGERVELVENECCVRSARPWRPTPRPS